MKRIRLLATSDVHGYIYPYSYATGDTFYGGFARLKTLIDSLKDKNTLILDNGDVLEGSPLSFYHYHKMPLDISPMTKAMNSIEYDYVNVGNHDFNYGEECLMMHLQNLKAPCITNNWYYHGNPYGPTYVVREFDGIKVALFGLVTQYIPQWETKEHIAHSKFISAVESAKKTVETIKRFEKPDYIVCMYHGGFERDLQTGIPSEDLTGENEAYELVKSIPGIDILISGHQHRSLNGKLFNTYYTQTSANGTELACIDIFPESHTIETHILTCDTDADKELLAPIQYEENACQAWLDTPLGTSNIDLTIKDENDARIHKSQVVTFLNKVTLEYSGADLAANAIFLGTTGFKKEITMRDIVSTYVYPNTLVVKKITGKILREYLEKTADFFSITNNHTVGINPVYDFPKAQHYNYDMLDGVEYILKISNPVGSRVTSLTRNGEFVKEDDEFTLVVSNYRASGGGNYDMIKNAPVVKEISNSMVEILAEYIMDKKVIDFEPVNNIDVIV